MRPLQQFEFEKPVFALGPSINDVRTFPDFSTPSPHQPNYVTHLITPLVKDVPIHLPSPLNFLNSLSATNKNLEIKHVYSKSQL